MKTAVAKAQRGDRASLTQILQDVYPALYKTAFLYVKNEADALDIVQDVVIKVMTKLPQLKEEAYFETWAIRITIFTSLDFLKKAQRQEQELRTEEVAQLIASGQGLADNLDIYEAIKRLPTDLQELTILHYFHGKKISEISTLQNVPVGTVKSRLHRLRQLLKNYLTEGMEDDNE